VLIEVILVFFCRREEISVIDYFGNMAGKYGLFWTITKPDAFFIDKYVKLHLICLWGYVISFILCFITMLTGGASLAESLRQSF
jgi:hypothetical protein